MTGTERIDGPASGFIARHWRGECSLAVSFWAVTVAGSVAIFSIALALNAALGAESSGAPRPAMAAVWSAVLAATVWQHVGAWRACGRHILRGGAPFWATSAKVALALNFIRVGIDVAHYAVGR